MKKVKLTNQKVRFNDLTNKSKRNVYKEICKRYNGNNICSGIKFNFYRDIPKMAARFFEYYPHLFIGCYKMKIYTK
jgi:hypothetical protein